MLMSMKISDCSSYHDDQAQLSESPKQLSDDLHTPVIEEECEDRDCSFYLPTNSFLTPPVILLRTPTVLFTIEPDVPEALDLM